MHVHERRAFPTMLLFALLARTQSQHAVCDWEPSACDGTYNRNNLHINSTSGTVPTQLGLISHLMSLDLGNQLSGVLPTELGLLDQLRGLSLDANAISGTIPTQFGHLGQLKTLSLGSMALGGSIPSQLARLSQLRGLSLGGNSLTGVIPRGIVHSCMSHSCMCSGLPPYGCTAFGRDARPSLYDIGTCTPCKGERHAAKVTAVLTALAFSAVLTIIPLSLYFVHRFPYFKTWVATVSILLSHMQVLSFCSSLVMFEGSRVSTAAEPLAFIFFNTLVAVQPECLLPQESANWSIMLAGAVALLLPMMCICTLCSGKACQKRIRCLKCSCFRCLRPRRRRSSLEEPPDFPQITLSQIKTGTDAARASATRNDIEVPAPIGGWALPNDAETPDKYMMTDAIEDKIVILYALQLPSMAKFCLYVIILSIACVYDPKKARCARPGGARTWLPESWPLKWMYASPGNWCILILLFEALFAFKLFRHIRALQGRTNCRGRPHTPLPRTRLAVRLRYMVGKYRENDDPRFWNHAPYYNLVVWSRQLFIAFLSLVLLDRWRAQAAATIGMLLISLAYHWRVQAFAFSYQNKLEALLHVQGIVLLSLGCVYRRLLIMSQPGSANATDVLALVVLFSPGVIVLNWLYHRYLVEKQELFSADELRVLQESLQVAQRAAAATNQTDSRYTADAKDLAGAAASVSARGVRAQLGLPDDQLYAKLARGVEAIEEEWRAHGSFENQRQLYHVLHEPASDMEGLAATGEFVEGRAGQFLEYYVTHPTAVRAGLSRAEVVALRLYTSAAFDAINAPLRSFDRTEPYPYPATVMFIKQGIEKLRALNAPDVVESEAATEKGPARLWRGMQNVRVCRNQLMHEGATELAPLSFTTNIGVAAGFAQSRTALLLLVNPNGPYLQQGVSLRFLSLIPQEDEIVYPPCTYLRPTGRTALIELGDASVTGVDGLRLEVVEMETVFGS